MGENARKRAIEYDVMRLFACFTILTIHFNAAISGWNNGVFVYNNSIIPNMYFDKIYLGEIGNSLFFIISGAALLCNKDRNIIDSPQKIKHFYFSRMLSIYPAFWIVWFLSTVIDFLRNKMLPIGSFGKLLVSIIALDGYAWDRGWMDQGYYQIGEWFLGCIIICYLLWPIVTFIWSKLPRHIFCVAIFVLYIILVKVSGGNDRWIPIRLIEMIIGGIYTDSLKNKKGITLCSIGVCFICILTKNYLSTITVAFSFCAMLFVCGCSLIRIIDLKSKQLEIFLSTASVLTYPVFLVHHKLISMLVVGFDLSVIRKSEIAFMYAVYLVGSIIIAVVVKRMADAIISFFKNIQKG